MRSFFLEKGFLEVHTQNRLSILAACEDPTTVTTYEYAGEVWPLPQTGQMWLEYELLTNPDIDLCKFLGFTCDHNRARLTEDFPGGNYLSMCGKYTASDNILTDYHESLMYKDYGDVFFLTHFPYNTSPFWNMKKSDVKGSTGDEVALKCDVIMGGMETIGSAERADDVDMMREQFHTISDGGYSRLLYNLFGQDRVLKELDEFLQHDFVPRFGGGIGVTRMISAMKKAELI
jgi:aspartyl/asparaginyl-tRNA synthetase